MADTNTPNILLLLPDLNDPFNFGAHVENNFTTIDSLMGAVQCTSTTRPTNTFAGQIIYETDSKRYAQNTGTKAAPVWTYMSHAAFVCTSTTRPTVGLSVGLLIYETDTHRFLIYNGTTWEQKAFSNFVCTSSTHPASPFQGLEIYETDTGLGAVYSGSNYQYGLQQAAPTQVLGSTTASITFSGLPAVNGYMLKWSARMSDANAAEQLYLRFNGDTGSNYLWEVNQANNAAVAGTTSGAATTFIQAGTVTANSATADYWATGFVIINCGGTGQYTTATSYGSAFATTTNMWAGVYGGQWLSTATVTSITMQGSTGSFLANSRFSIYALP